MGFTMPHTPAQWAPELTSSERVPGTVDTRGAMGRASAGHERKVSTHQPDASRCPRRRHGKLLPEHPEGAKQTRQLPQTSLAEAGNLTRRALSERPRNA